MIITKTDNTVNTTPSRDIRLLFPSSWFKKSVNGIFVKWGVK